MDDDAALLTRITAGIDRPNAAGIAAGMGRMISAGVLPEGTRLPTVRALATALAVSPTTVSEAWRTLTAAGAIEPQGRRGTFVHTSPGPGGAQRYRRVTEGPGHFTLDLSTGTPDPDLLPDLAPIIGAISGLSLTTTYVDPPVLPELEAQLRATWPFPPDALTVVDGCMDALDRIAGQVVRLGDRVVVEDPTFPPVLDLLDRLGAEVIGVGMDDEGLRLDELEAALARRPSLLLLQPRAQNPTGTTMSRRRARAIADLVGAHGPLVVEDDHSGDVASGALQSVGRWLPERTVHVRGFSKSHGPDLRLAAVGGAGAVVEAVADRRLLGPGWSSRILQAVLLGLLTDPDACAAVDAARATYAHRRARVVAGLRRRGITPGGSDGLNLWVPVADERSALVTLAAQGIGVAPGEPFAVGGRPTGDHVRVTVGLAGPDDAALDDLATRLAEAAGAAGRPARRPRT